MSMRCPLSETEMMSHTQLLLCIFSISRLSAYTGMNGWIRVSKRFVPYLCLFRLSYSNMRPFYLLPTLSRLSGAVRKRRSYCTWPNLCPASGVPLLPSLAAHLPSASNTMKCCCKCPCTPVSIPDGSRGVPAPL